MKKLMSLLLCLALVFVASAPAFAADIEVEAQPISVTINEYQALKELAEESSVALAQAGYSSNEITAIQNYHETYVTHVSNLNTLSDAALSANGYSASQITTIRSFSGTEAELTSLGATLTIYSTPTAFSYTTGGRTTGRLAYNWYWTGIPAIKMKDMVAASWNNWVVTDNSSYVSYYSVNTGAYYTQEEATFEYASNDVLTGAGHKFYMTMSDNYYYAKSGGGTFDVKSDGLYQKDFYYYIEYGHATLSYDIGFGVSIPGGVAASINFSVVTADAGSDSGSYVW